jgi:hypothetical protein
VNLALTLLNAGIDLLSFAGILFSIYPPLFAALLAYSLGGTGISLFLGKVGLQGGSSGREQRGDHNRDPITKRTERLGLVR